MESEITVSRNYLPSDLKITSWEDVESYFKDLQDRKFNNVDDLQKWMKDKSELESFLEEDMAWRYIKMNIDTRDEELAKSFHFFVEEIEPRIAPYNDDFNKKLVNSEFVSQLEGQEYEMILRQVRNEIKIYREENIPLNTELQKLAQQYGSISAAMSVKIDGKELTMQQAAKLLKSTDRNKREEVYHLIQKRRLEDKEKLNELFDQLIQLRDKVASNAGYENYRDYMFDAMGRFDYTKEDCFQFHEAIASEIVPLTNGFLEERKKKMNLEVLRPWDTQVDPDGLEPLNPFEGGEELLNKSIDCFEKVRPEFAEVLRIMNDLKHLDLDSKTGKAPGGFNYPLYETGVPFIFMNAVGSLRDVVTMVHEGGHAIHSYLTRDLELVEFKSLTSEIAELASMSMELISMEHWEVFFTDEEELKRAKREQLQQVLETLPWVAQIDKFQHWIYENPGHSHEERYNEWVKINKKFGGNAVEWSGLDDERKNMWQKQLHLFEVPFYYIEYGMAQLGAIAIWKNYKERGDAAVEEYKNGLKLGYTKPIGEVYKEAGVEFNFSKEYVGELAEFIKRELDQLN